MVVFSRNGRIMQGFHQKSAYIIITEAPDSLARSPPDYTPGYFFLRVIFYILINVTLDQEKTWSSGHTR